MFGNKGFTPKNNQQKFRLTKGFTHHSKNQNNEYMQNIYQIIDSVPNSKTTLDQSHNLNNSKHINKTTINNFETADQYQSFNYNNENFLNVQDQQQKQGTKKQLYNITSFKINQAKNNGQPLSTRMQGQNLQLDDIENKAQQYYFPQGIGQSQKSGNYTNRENYLKSFDLKNANHSYRNTSENQNKIHRMAQQQADTKLINNQSNNNHLNPYQKGKTIPLKNFQNQAQNKQSSELNSLRQTQNLKNINKEENQAYQNQQQFTQKLQNLNLTQNQKQNQNQTPKNQKNVTNLKDQKRQTFFENMKKPDLKDMKEGFKKFDFLIKNRPNRGQTTYENINNTNINNYNNNNNNNNNNNSRQQQNKQQNNNQQQPVYYDLNQFFFNSSKAQQSSDNNNNYKSENTTRATSNMTQNQSKFTENDHQKNVEDILMNENSMDNFEFGKVLGLGSYAVVRQSVHKPTNQILAIKTYDKKKLSDPMKLKNVQREIKILSRLRHPNIIRLYQIIETDNQVHLIMELSSQTPLNDFMKTKRSKRVNEEEARLIIKQLAEALKYGHRKCVVHRDIKLENVLIDQNKIVKLVDFGFAVVVPPGHYLNIFCGTPSYMAPEIVNKQDYAFSVDVWALAVMAFKLVSGHFPFKGQSDKELYRKINNCRPEFPSFFSPELKRFIMKIFKQSSNERLQAEDIIKDDWIQGRKSEIDDEFSNPEKMFIERVF
ncbi:Protein kinase-like domain [Pseudocohnilembus persalinus]|uniref:Protein kinase-like domain n=1 Tax=Pseudocohnilembus persalinus TaxID=266149 RepID=A0A0V0QUT8_PSEPJ|nr:Protein kinase-like domain [Pseudocohnilembus persalinus]|eukprot:KRX06124.1 Protein kinase-like domain [Pseudocohnilembus persalinus]